ncbi:hypothetical protein ACFL02_09675, partial [Planctomycetota bacterium]
ALPSTLHSTFRRRKNGGHGPPYHRLYIRLFDAGRMAGMARPTIASVFVYSPSEEWRARPALPSILSVFG